MTDHDKRLLAELKGLPAFKVLLNAFADFEGGLLAELALAHEPLDVLNAGRAYQFCRRVREALANRPEAIAEELEALKENSVVDGPQLTRFAW